MTTQRSRKGRRADGSERSLDAVRWVGPWLAAAYAAGFACGRLARRAAAQPGGPATGARPGAAPWSIRRAGDRRQGLGRQGAGLQGAGRQGRVAPPAFPAGAASGMAGITTSDPVSAIRFDRDGEPGVLATEDAAIPPFEHISGNSPASGGSG